jgi:hypothetical protein
VITCISSEASEIAGALQELSALPYEAHGLGAPKSLRQPFKLDLASFHTERNSRDPKDDSLVEMASLAVTKRSRLLPRALAL